MFNDMATLIATEFHNDAVQPIQRGEKHRGSEGGVYYDPPTPLGDPLQCNIQPYSAELAQRDYGLVVETSLRLFALPDERLKPGALMQWEGKPYRIKAMPPARSMAVALLEDGYGT